MTTIDNLLLNIVNTTSPMIEEQIPARDARVLRSLATAVTSHHFITENQSRLLVKILKEHQKKLPNFDEEITTLLTAPLWSKAFRQIEQVKRLFVSQPHNGDPVIVAEFTFSSPIRKTIENLSKKLENLIQANAGKLYHADLTEKNIVLLVDALEPHGFSIDETLKNHYDTIKSWSETDTKGQFQLTTITNQNFAKHITADLGIATAIDQNIIADRSMRYQYFVEKTEKSPENLTEQLATRTSTKVWVDKNIYSLEDLVSSLIELKRLPVMFVFDGFNPSNQHHELNNVAKCLDTHQIYDHVGFYFRLPNNSIGKEFNEIIAERKYNCVLDKDTKVVGVQSGKIPKFFLNNEWKPMSVVSVNTNLRHSKTAVYSNCCDLVISYCDTQPIVEKTYTWR